MKQNIIILLLVVLFSSCNKEEGNEYYKLKEVKVDFFVNDTLLTIWEQIELKNQSDSLDVQYYWDFGDGSFSNEKNPIHSYNQSGEYYIKLIVSDGHNNIDSTSHKVKVGDCYVYELELLDMWNFKDYTEEIPWDEDSLGVSALPDIFVKINDYEKQNSVYETSVIYKYNPKHVPLRIQIPEIKIHEGNVLKTPHERCEITFYDYDGNQNEFIASNKLTNSILSFSGYKYDKKHHIGEYVVTNQKGIFKIKYVIK